MCEKSFAELLLVSLKAHLAEMSLGLNLRSATFYRRNKRTTGDQVALRHYSEPAHFSNLISSNRTSNSGSHETMLLTTSRPHNPARLLNGQHLAGTSGRPHTSEVSSQVRRRRRT